MESHPDGRTDRQMDGRTDERTNGTDENYISLRHTLYAGGIKIGKVGKSRTTWKPVNGVEPFAQIVNKRLHVKYNDNCSRGLRVEDV